MKELDLTGPDTCAQPAPSTPVVNPPSSAEMTSMPLAEMGLQPGTIILMSSEHGNAACHHVRLVGYAEKKSVIVSHPESEGQLLFVKNGTDFHCKGFHGKRAFHFHARAMHSQLQPYAYLHLTYPDKVCSKAVRSSHRIKTSIIASVMFAGAADSIPATIRDLGLNGVQIHLPDAPCKVGAQVQLAFRLTIDDEKQLFDIAAVVKRALPVTSEAGYRALELGVQFIDLPLEKRRLLEIHVYRNLLAVGDPV